MRSRAQTSRIWWHSWCIRTCSSPWALRRLRYAVVVGLRRRRLGRRRAQGWLEPALGARLRGKAVLHPHMKKMLHQWCIIAWKQQLELPKPRSLPPLPAGTGDAQGLRGQVGALEQLRRCTSGVVCRCRWYRPDHRRLPVNLHRQERVLRQRGQRHVDSREIREEALRAPLARGIEAHHRQQGDRGLHPRLHCQQD